MHYYRYTSSQCPCQIFINVSKYSDVDFHFGKKLGQGSFATLTLVTEKKTNKQYAMKIIEKSKTKGMEGQIIKEVMILKKFEHPNVFLNVISDRQIA